METTASAITHVFADGGCILANPSAYGGTWAYVHVDLAGDRKLDGRCGVITSSSFGAPVTNNAMELYAVLRALEGLPDGWTGIVATDSQCTLQRWTGTRRDFKGIPWEWSDRMTAVLARLGELTWWQLAGHPTLADLMRGHKVKLGPDGGEIPGLPVSKWQTLCDKQCRRLAYQYRASYGLSPAPREPIVFDGRSPEELVASGPFAPLVGYVAARP
jgi:ribonuclease HI